MRSKTTGLCRNSDLAWLPVAPGTPPQPHGLISTVSFPADGTVSDRVSIQAVANPGQQAIVAPGSVVSYAELMERVADVCTSLRASGCGPGDMVACLGRRGVHSPVLFLALERIGAIYLPLDPAWPRARITEIIELSGSILLADYTAAEAVVPQLTALDHRPGDAAPPVIAEAAPRYVIYTSGTTGRPKGAIVTQAGMLNHLAAKIADLRLTAADRVAFTAPLAFDISIWQMLAPLMAGGTLVIGTDDDVRYPRRLLHLLGRQRVSIVELVPTTIGALTAELARSDAAHGLTSLRWLISTGEELKPGLAERVLRALPQAGLLNAYGPTECSDDVTHYRVTRRDLAKPRLPVGHPIGGARLYCLIYRPSGGVWAAAHPGEPGEVFVGGIPVGLGYLGDPETTRGAFFQDSIDAGSATGRLYRTGDLGWIGDDGLHYLGRVDRQVKIAGLRLELDEIEAVLSRHPRVSQCAVALAQGKGARPVLTAYYVRRGPVSAPDLQEFLSAALPSAAVPRRWVQLDALPLTANGKVDYRALLLADNAK